MTTLSVSLRALTKSPKAAKSAASVTSTFRYSMRLTNEAHASSEKFCLIWILEFVSAFAKNRRYPIRCGSHPKYDLRDEANRPRAPDTGRAKVCALPNRRSHRTTPNQNLFVYSSHYLVRKEFFDAVWNLFSPSRCIAISETKAGGIMSSNTTHRYTFVYSHFTIYLTLVKNRAGFPYSVTTIERFCDLNQISFRCLIFVTKLQILYYNNTHFPLSDGIPFKI